MRSPFVRLGLVAMACLLTTACTKKEENPLDSGLSGNPLTNNLSLSPSPSASPGMAVPSPRAEDPFGASSSLLGGMGKPKPEVATAPRSSRKAAKRGKGKRMKKGKHRRGKARKKGRRRRR